MILLQHDDQLSYEEVMALDTAALGGSDNGSYRTRHVKICKLYGYCGAPMASDKFA